MRKQGLIFQLIVIVCTVVCIAGGVTLIKSPAGFLIGAVVGVLLNLIIKAALPARMLPGLNGAQLSSGQRQAGLLAPPDRRGAAAPGLPRQHRRCPHHQVRPSPSFRGSGSRRAALPQRPNLAQ